MKTLAPKFIVLALAVALGTPAFTGCSSTATRESTGEYIDDSVLTAKVKTALARDKIVNAGAVTIETFKGTVQLSGFVDSAEQKQQAETVAKGVSGVQAVVNNITVKGDVSAMSNPPR